ncbi:MAG TPA: hypothetical protein VEL76_21070 [Gemmataceae bacterium]|nr:hypothetical protein [Gemmataceae bacterium]
MNTRPVRPRADVAPAVFAVAASVATMLAGALGRIAVRGGQHLLHGVTGAKDFGGWRT